MTKPLPRLPDESFQRVLCVAAHPDDIEYGASSAVAVWTSRGVNVAYLMLTRGEAGMDASTPDDTRTLRTAEQIAAGAAVGVGEIEFFDYPDGMMELGLGLRRDISRAIRTFRPDVVLTGSWEVEFVAGLNQADHRVAGIATLDAVRDAGNRWVFPELLEEGLEPWSVRWLLVPGHSEPTHGVEVTGEPLERGIAALEAHQEYLAGIPGHPPARMMLTMITKMQGAAIGAENAVLLRAWDFQAPPPMVADLLAAGGPPAGE
ncbi:MAG: PIG-L deacetylase family protein [Nakamurella sp.]